MGIQFFEELDRSVHCFWGGPVAFLAALFEALLFVGVVFEVVIVEFYIERRMKCQYAY
jgi:hypothetical protein